VTRLDGTREWYKRGVQYTPSKKSKK
jgi:hypothetical protein